jgi:hypothetical protein
VRGQQTWVTWNYMGGLNFIIYVFINCPTIASDVLRHFKEENHPKVSAGRFVFSLCMYMKNMKFSCYLWVNVQNVWYVNNYLSQAWWLTSVIPATWRSRDWEHHSLSPNQAKVSKTPSYSVSWARWCPPVISATQEA